MKHFFLFALSIFMLTYTSCSDNPTKAEESGSIEGIVYDASSGLTLFKANIITKPPTSSVTTDTSGFYKITNVDAGTYRVTALKADYDSAGVNILVIEGLMTTADIQLSLSDTAAVNF